MKNSALQGLCVCFRGRGIKSEASMIEPFEVHSILNESVDPLTKVSPPHGVYGSFVDLFSNNCSWFNGGVTLKDKLLGSHVCCKLEFAWDSEFSCRS
jgi:hypothetical protein